MADSCRPASRHGRYNAAGPSSVQYNADAAPYGNVDYTPSDEMYTVNQPDRPERPRTSHGARHSRVDIPPRPESRRSGQGRQHEPPPADRDHESYGRPASRVGFSPESSYRYSHDEFSRQMTLESERQLHNSPSNSPDVMYTNNRLNDPYGESPPQRNIHRQSPQQPVADRLIVSPTNPAQSLSKKSPRSFRHRQNQQMYRRSPQSYSPQPETSYVRPSSRDYMNVSPIPRDEPQLQDEDLHHHSNSRSSNHGGEMYSQEGDSYQQHFSDNPQFRNSPYRDSPQFRNSPYRDSPQHRDSPAFVMDSPYHPPSPTYGQPYPGSPESHYRPPPAPRPKSARPKTGRKKSARARHRHEEQETSQPQHCDASSILNTGDPYGRPSSSLSRYKPLPAIGVATPRAQEDVTRANLISESFSSPLQSKVDMLSADTHRLNLDDENQFRPADDDADAFSAEDIHGANSESLFANQGIPSVDMLTNFPQHLSEEIYKHAVANHERNNGSNLDDGSENKDRSDGSGDSLNSADNHVSSSLKPLDFVHKLPAELSEGEIRLLLAVKLPDGKRIQRYFSPDDTLQSVLYFAENSSLVCYSDYQLVCNAPKTVFIDLSVKIRNTDLQDRTVLYLEEKE